MLQIKSSKIAICLLLLILTFSASAQTKRKTAKGKTVKKTVAAKTQTPSVEEADAATAPKKNARPDQSSEQTPTAPTDETVKANSRPAAAAKDKPVYFYEFSQPSFQVSQIHIEHDENGRGKITFQKKDLNEPITDPLQLSADTLERLKVAWTALNFLDSTENYQTARDYSNMGNMKFTMRKDGKEREAKFNWTENKDAKALADEYRRIGQQSVWIFDIGVARENQPLETPRQLDALDSLIRRNEISDTAQMLPLLQELANDERLPLIARNHATKLAGQIEKSEKKK